MADEPPPNKDAKLIEDILEPYKMKGGLYDKMKEDQYRVARIYMDLSVEKESMGRVEIDLPVIKTCPKTCANFLALCHGGYADAKGRNVCYKGTSLFRSIPNFCVCGGDVVNDNGTSGSSIYENATFNDEKSGFGFDRPGTVATLQQGGGPNTNGSQFTILLTPSPWLEKTNVPFGVVTAGLDVVERVVEKYYDPKGKPTKTVLVHHCGIK